MIDLKQYGYTETETPPDDLLPGRVTEHRGAQYTVVTERGEVYCYHLIVKVRYDIVESWDMI